MSNIKRLPSKFNDEELLEIIQDTTNPEVLEKPSEHTVIQFLADFGIYPGEEKVEGRLLFKLYIRSMENRVFAPEFHLLLRGYLQYEYINNQIVYSVNRKSVDLAKQLSIFLANKKSRKVNTRFFRKHFEQFLEVHCLKSGGTKNMPAGALYFFYDKWQYESKVRTRLRFNVFTSIMRLYLKTKRTNKVWCVVKVNNEFYKQFSNEIPIALKWAEKFNGKSNKKEDGIREKKAKPKIKNKVPSSKE